MSVWVVVGGQFGSEGKGKVAAHIVRKEEIDICVRTGGPNAGHSYHERGKEKVVLRQLPTGVINPLTRLLIPAGAVVDLHTLFTEMNRFNLDEKRVGVDRNAFILTEDDREKEKQLTKDISSTGSGTGAATARRVMRTSGSTAESNYESWFRPLLTDVAKEINEAVDQNKSILIEGSQGAGLSLYHSAHYPKVTSRDTTAAGVISEVGLSPKLVDNIVLVLRTFPIRVAGQQAGLLTYETTWDEIKHRSGAPDNVNFGEYTSVTRKLRRVGTFDIAQAKKAVMLNRPTHIAVMGVDYLSYHDLEQKRWQDLSEISKEFLNGVCTDLGDVRYVGTGPHLEDMINN